MTTLKVLQVMGRSAGGIARHVDQIATALHGADGLLVDVAAPAGLPLAIERLRHSVEIPDGPLRGHRSAIGRLRRILRDDGYEVVHAHGLRAGIDAALAAMEGTRVLVTVHNLVRSDVTGRWKAPLYGLAESIAVAQADRVLAVSQEIEAHLKSRVPSSASKVEVLYLGVGAPPTVTRSRAAVRRDLGIPERAPLVVTASRLSAQKALPVMLEAVARLEEVHVALLGEGPDEAALRARAAALGLGRRAHLLGFRSDVHEVISAGDCFCLSSVWEGVPLAAQEAILLGIPVVATRVGGMPELIDDRSSGRLVPKGDVDALTAALGEVLSDRPRAQAYATNARARLEERFSTERMLSRLTRLYRGAPTATDAHG